jgi:hypothetical protein
VCRAGRRTPAQDAWFARFFRSGGPGGAPGIIPAGPSPAAACACGCCRIRQHPKTQAHHRPAQPSRPSGHANRPNPAAAAPHTTSRTAAHRKITLFRNPYGTGSPGHRAACARPPGSQICHVATLGTQRPLNSSLPEPDRTGPIPGARKCQTLAISSNRHRKRLDIRANLGSNRYSHADQVRGSVSPGRAREGDEDRW